MAQYFGLIEGIIAFFPILYLSGFVHECGHAIMGRLNGFVVTAFGMGLARPAIVLPCGGTRVFICRVQPFQGLTTWFRPRLYPPKRQELMAFAGGIIGNAVLAFIGLSLWLKVSLAQPVWIVTAGINIVLALLNLIPFKIRAGKFVTCSDGMHIVLALRKEMFLPPTPVRIDSLKILSRLADSIGDKPGLYMWQLQQALAWLELDVLERARAAYERLSTAPVHRTAAMQGLEAYLRAILAKEEKRLEEAEQACQQVEESFRSVDSETAAVLSELIIADIRSRTHDPATALNILDELARRPLVQQKPALQPSLLTVRVVCGAQLAEDNQLRAAVIAYEKYHRRKPSSILDIVTYRAVGQHYAKRQDWNAAEIAYQKVLSAVSEVYDLFSDPSDQEAFLRAQASFVAEANACFRQVGKISEEQTVEHLITSTEQRQLERSSELRARSERYNHWGLLLTLVNVLCLPVSIAAIFLEPAITPRGDVYPIAIPPAVFASCVIFLTIVIMLCRLFFFIAGRARPDLRGLGGAITLALAVAPWLVAALFGLIAFFI